MRKRTVALCLALILLSAALLAGCHTDTVESDPPAEQIPVSEKNVVTCDTRYQATATQDPYASMTAFRDEHYYYYLLPLGTLSNVPLEKDVMSYRYDGNAYTYTLTTEVATTESVETSLETAMGHCLSHSTSLELGAEAGMDGVKASVEAGMSTTASTELTSTESIRNASEHSARSSRQVQLTFDESNAHGYYRWILMGEVAVYGVILYDLQAQTYHFDTYNVILASAYCLDYSTSMTFDDSRYGKLDFTFDEERVKGIVPTEWIKAEEAPLPEGDGSTLSPYLITSAVQLARIATEEGKHSKLTRDLDLNGQYIKPISAFAGHLDGNGFAIYHFVISGGEEKSGLFQENNGTICNLTVGKTGYTTKITASCSISSVSVGGIVGINNGTIENCKAEALTLRSGITGGKQQRIYAYAGGIAAQNTGRIKGCTAVICQIYGNATQWLVNRYNAYAYAGGIAGLHSGSIESCYTLQNTIHSYAETEAHALDSCNAYTVAGGLVGKVETDGTLRQCIANGNAVTADGKVSGGRKGHKAIHADS